MSVSRSALQTWKYIKSKLFHKDNQHDITPEINERRVIIGDVYFGLWATTTKTVCKVSKDYDTLEELPSTSTYKRDVRNDQWHTWEQIKKSSHWQ